MAGIESNRREKQSAIVNSTGQGGRFKIPLELKIKKPEVFGFRLLNQINRLIIAERAAGQP
jgi:hypothetical protein